MFTVICLVYAGGVLMSFCESIVQRIAHADDLHELQISESLSDMLRDALTWPYLLILALSGLIVAALAKIRRST